MIGSANLKRIATAKALGILAALGNRLPALALPGVVAAVVTALGLWEYEPLRTRLRPKASV